MELEWSDLRVILAICREGSLSGAARVLGQSHSTVFRRINAIEERTGVRFFERMPNGYFMTDAGESARASAERIEGEVHALSRAVLGQDARLQGKVRITAPEGIAMGIAPHLLAEFCREHPGVTVELGGGASALDLTRREADVAIRATRKPPDASLGKRVCDFRFAVYAMPDHIEAHRDVPLAEQDWVLLEGVVGWLVPLVWKKREDGERRTVFSSGTTIMAAIEAARAGMGVTLLPCYLGDSDDQLVRATTTLDPLDLELWLLTHPDLRQTARVKALMTFLQERFTAQRDLFEGGRVRKGAPPPLQLR